ncbi:unnamed protein product [Medioppia subpectinata]|uniref:Uncharacterized protein n=1 Tax=Medioppia subpectinata TaxID=1979941 RepID=A0A7R9KH16_9ACAR|nr:unnamed protein product [Medioppia subpectinata]CAG2103235.1 unnamed protein product [Medioppia subpectinata]
MFSQNLALIFLYVVNGISCQYQRQHIFDNSMDTRHDKQPTGGHMVINPGKHTYGRSYGLPAPTPHASNEHSGHQHRLSPKSQSSTIVPAVDNQMAYISVITVLLIKLFS